MKVAVIGAGPAGLTAALKLREGGADVDVFEASSFVGGLSRSIELWGHRVDIGPHRFLSADQRINQFWLDIVGRDYQMVRRLTRVYFRDGLIDYPIRPLSAMRQLGWIDATRCLVSYLRQKVIPVRETDAEPSFEDWVTHRFGRRLFEMFFKSYSEKLWGIPCTQLSSDFAAQRIRGFSLWEAFRNAVSPNAPNKHKTLADRFAYPLGGTGSVYEKMAKRFCNAGGELMLGSPVERILRDRNRVTGLRMISGEQYECDHVISTMPLTRLVEGLSHDEMGVPDEVKHAARELQFRNTILIYLHVDSDSVFPDQWLYIHAPNVRAGRVTNFRNWVPQLYGDQTTSVLAVEQWCGPEDQLWKQEDEALIQNCEQELRSIGLLRSENVLDGYVMKIPRSYPVYRRGYRKHLRCIGDYLARIAGLTPIGRYGAFKYNNQDHSILMGLLTADNILGSARHDLWNVNSDFDEYQEKSAITDSGLVQLT